MLVLHFRMNRPGTLQTHFIFGMGISAVIIEKQKYQKTEHGYKILSGKFRSKFSSNIRNNFGFLCRKGINQKDYLFMQDGKKVKSEVVPLASQHILEHLSELNIPPDSITRLWLH